MNQHMIYAALNLMVIVLTSIVIAIAITTIVVVVYIGVYQVPLVNADPISRAVVKTVYVSTLVTTLVTLLKNHWR